MRYVSYFRELGTKTQDEKKILKKKEEETLKTQQTQTASDSYPRRIVLLPRYAPPSTARGQDGN